jgi:hypothetical protein
VFPGGFGTLDELFEILTLKQTGKAPPIPILLYDEGYWRSIVRFERLAEHGMISEEDLGIFVFADEPQAAWDAVWRREVEVERPFSAPEQIGKAATL